MILLAKRAAALCSAWLLLGWPKLAHAADSTVRLELEACPALSEPTLREHLDLELTTLELSRVDALLRIRCDGSAVGIELTRSSGSRYPVEVRVDLRDTARAARERLLALAATELIAQAERARGKPQPGRSAVTSVEPTEIRARDEVPQESDPSARRYSELFLAGSVALDGKPTTTLWGGSLGTSLGLTRSWSLLLDTRFEHGESSTPLASVRWSVLSGFVGPLFHGQLGPLRPAIGVGLRAGWLALAAAATAPYEGRSMTAPWAGLALPLRLGVELGGLVTPFLGAEVGFVVVPVRGNVEGGPALAEQQGLWLSAHVGVGVGL